MMKIDKSNTNQMISIFGIKTIFCHIFHQLLTLKLNIIDSNFNTSNIYVNFENLTTQNLYINKYFIVVTNE